MIWRAWWQHKWTLLAGLLLALITLCAGVALLSLSGWFISAAAFAGLTVVSAAQFNYLLPAAGVRLFALLRIACRYGERVVSHQATFKILTNLRVSAYRMIEPLAPGHLLRFHSSDLLNRLVADVAALDNIYLRLVTPVIAAVCVIALTGVFFSIYDRRAAWVVVAMLIVTGFLLPVAVICLGRGASRALSVARASIRRQVVERIQLLSELLVYQGVAMADKQFATIHQRLLSAQRRLAHIDGASAGLFTLLSGATLVLVLWVSATHVVAGQYRGALIALLVLGAMGAFEAVIALPRAFKNIGETRDAMTRVQALATAKPAVTFLEQDADVAMSDGGVSFDKVSFGYDVAMPVLKAFSLEIAHNEKIGFVGPSGSGKTTLLQLLPRAFDPQQGKVRWRGIDVREFSEAQLRSQMVVISQFPHLFQSSLRDNITLGRSDISDIQIIGALARVQLDGWVQDLRGGLDTWLGEQGMKLSGGQRQRVAIARGICHDAPLWLLDEPTEGLDAQTETALINDLTPILADKTVMLATHRRLPLQLVSRVVDLSKL